MGLKSVRSAQMSKFVNIGKVLPAGDGDGCSDLGVANHFLWQALDSRYFMERYQRPPHHACAVKYAPMGTDACYGLTPPPRSSNPCALWLTDILPLGAD